MNYPYRNGAAKVCDWIVTLLSFALIVLFYVGVPLALLLVAVHFILKFW